MTRLQTFRIDVNIPPQPESVCDHADGPNAVAGSSKDLPIYMARLVSLTGNRLADETSGFKPFSSLVVLRGFY
jgi:hypothetical protein